MSQLNLICVGQLHILKLHKQVYLVIVLTNYVDFENKCNKFKSIIFTSGENTVCIITNMKKVIITQHNLKKIIDMVKFDI